MRELWSKIKEALISALPIILIVYAVSLLPWFHFTRDELVIFTISAVMLVMGMGKKAQGIAFSLPVSDAAGLVGSVKPEKEVKE